MHEPDTFAAVRVEEHGPVDAAGCEVANVMGEQLGAARPSSSHA